MCVSVNTSIESELYASIATLDQLRRLYQMGLVDVAAFRRESQALISEITTNIERMRRDGLSVEAFYWNERISERFPEAVQMLNISPGASERSDISINLDDYYDEIGLAVLDVATEHASKGFMGLAEMIVQVIRRLPQFKNIHYNDVIEAVNRVARNGLLPGVRVLRGGVKVVQLRPLELGPDQAEVVSLAATKGYLTLEEVMIQLKWSEDHARQVLASLVEAGIAIPECRLSTGSRYHFPGLRSSNDERLPRNEPE